MDYETIEKLAPPLFNVLAFVVPAWLIFYPPRRLRARPFRIRPPVALAVSLAGEYLLYYGLVAPANEALLRTFDSGVFFDGPLMFADPVFSWGATSLYIILLLLARSLWLIGTARTADISLLPESASPQPTRPRPTPRERAWFCGAVIVWTLALFGNGVCFARLVKALIFETFESRGWTIDAQPIGVTPEYWIYLLPMSLAFIAAIAAALVFDQRSHFVHRTAHATREYLRRKERLLD